MFDICQWCGRLFQSEHPAKWCTPTCRTMAYVARRVAREPEYADVMRARAQRNQTRRRRAERAGNVMWPNP